MKYIRTKNGRIIKVAISKEEYERDYKNSNVSYAEWFGCFSFSLDIVKQADTIEELCDGFIITSKQGHIYDSYGDYGYELKEVLPQAREEYPDEDWDLYGCILVDGIIKQVAKLNNEKGVLELL